MINKLKHIRHTEANSFFLIAGPCAVESEAILTETAGQLKEVCDDLQIPLIFKSSYKKANRSKLDSFSGIGDEEALELLSVIGKEMSLPLVTDVHAATEVTKAATVVDVLQIPAFLCRQTELIVAAAQSGCAVNIKKGQFLSPESMQFAVEKAKSTGNQNILITERGTTFGYQDLVVDFRGIPIMKQFDVPVVLDCTHSLQRPNQSSGVTGGLPSLIETIASAGIATGVDGLFIETHPDPSKALSDGANMLPLKEIKPLLEKLLKIYQAVH